MRTPAPLPTDDVSRLRLAIMRISRRIRQQSDLDVTPSQMSALMAVARCGPLTLGELAAHERVRPPTVSRIVRGLEGRGLVERSADPSDGRVVRLGLTPEGRRRIDAARSRSDTWLATRLAGLESDERAHLQALLPLLERLLEGPTS